MAVDRKGRGEGEGEQQQGNVIRVDAQRPLPELAAETAGVLQRLAHIDPAYQKRRQEDKAFRRGDEAKRLIDEVAQPGGQMRQCHPHQKQAAQGIKLRLARELHALYNSDGCGLQRQETRPISALDGNWGTKLLRNLAWISEPQREQVHRVVRKPRYR